MANALFYAVLRHKSTPRQGRVNASGALRAAFSEIEEVTFDRDLRAAFLNYLDQVYYPTLTPTDDGTAKLPQSVKNTVIDAAIARSQL